MPRGHVGTVQPVSPLLQQTELETPVTDYAGIGCTADHISGHKIAHHLAAKVISDIGRHVLHAQPAGQAARGKQKVGLVRPRGKLPLQIPHAQGEPHGLIARLLQQQAGSRAVSAA